MLHLPDGSTVDSRGRRGAADPRAMIESLSSRVSILTDELAVLERVVAVLALEADGHELLFEHDELDAIDGYDVRVQRQLRPSAADPRKDVACLRVWLERRLTDEDRAKLADPDAPAGTTVELPDGALVTKAPE